MVDEIADETVRIYNNFDEIVTDEINGTIKYNNNNSCFEVEEQIELVAKTFFGGVGKVVDLLDVIWSYKDLDVIQAGEIYPMLDSIDQFFTHNSALSQLNDIILCFIFRELDFENELNIILNRRDNTKNLFEDISNLKTLFDSLSNKDLFIMGRDYVEESTLTAMEREKQNVRRMFNDYLDEIEFYGTDNNYDKNKTKELFTALNRLNEGDGIIESFNLADLDLVRDDLNYILSEQQKNINTVLHEVIVELYKKIERDYNLDDSLLISIKEAVENIDMDDVESTEDFLEIFKSTIRSAIQLSRTKKGIFADTEFFQNMDLKTFVESFISVYISNFSIIIQESDMNFNDFEHYLKNFDNEKFTDIRFMFFVFDSLKYDLVILKEKILMSIINSRIASVVFYTADIRNHRYEWCSKGGLYKNCEDGCIGKIFESFYYTKNNPLTMDEYFENLDDNLFGGFEGLDIQKVISKMLLLNPEIMDEYIIESGIIHYSITGLKGIKKVKYTDKNGNCSGDTSIWSEFEKPIYMDRLNHRTLYKNLVKTPEGESFLIPNPFYDFKYFTKGRLLFKAIFELIVENKTIDSLAENFLTNDVPFFEIVEDFLDDIPNFYDRISEMIKEYGFSL